MLRGLYTGAAGMLATWSQVDVIANNLANVSTAGFKRDETVFRQFPAMEIRRTNDDVREVPAGTIDRRPAVGELGTGAAIDEIFTDFAQGSLRQTGNPLDLALDGAGFFAVETAQGMRYTRDGGFQVNREGYLTDSHGNLVQAELAAGGTGPLQLTSTMVSVGSDGTVAQGDPTQGAQQVLGRLILQAFDPPRALRKTGDNLYEAPAGVNGQRAQAAVKQGYVEQSNVNAIQEMVRLIEANRLFGIEEKIITTHDGLLNKALNEIPRS